MAKLLTWKDVTEDDIKELENSFNISTIKQLLRNKFQVNHDDDRKNNIEVDFHFYNYTFCKEQAFDSRQTSTCLSIMNEVFKKDCSISCPSNSMNASYQYFEKLVMLHSVDRPPISMKVFESPDSIAIIDHGLESYYRQFRLYKYIFGSSIRLLLKQVLPNEIEAPKSCCSLNSALHFTIIHPDNGSSS